MLFPRRQTWIPLTSASEWLKAVHETCWNPSALYVYIYIYTLNYIYYYVFVYIYIYMMNDYVCLYITIICNYICITWYIHNSINRLLFFYTCDPVIVSEHCMTRSYRHIGAGARCDVVGIRLIRVLFEQSTQKSLQRNF